MSELRLSCFVAAPPERCFDLSLSVELHRLSATGTAERAVAGVTTGLLGPGQEVTWEARHLGVRQRLTTRITAFERPWHFRDSQVRGAFRSFDHDHHFAAEGDGTRMVDVFTFVAPLGPLGWLADRAFLAGYMRRFLEERNRVLRRVAESDEWRALLP